MYKIGFLKKIISDFRSNTIYYILVLGLILRLLSIYGNGDSYFYFRWMKYFFSTLDIYYATHPPLFTTIGMLIFGTLTTIFMFSPIVYWSVLIILSLLIFKIKEINLHVRFIIITVLAYVWFSAYYVGLYESLVSISIFSGVLTLYVIYRLGEELFNKRVGLIASLLLCFSWWHIVYSDILLLDGFSTALISWAVLEYVKFVKKKISNKNIILPTISLTLALYSKYYSLFILPVLFTFILIQKKRKKELKYYLTPLVLSILIFGIWALYTNFYFMDTYVFHHRFLLQLPGLSAYYNFWANVLTLSILILAVPSFILLLVSRTENSKKLLLYFWFLIPFLIFIKYAFIDRLSHPLVNLSNYMLFTLPAVFLIVGVSYDRIIRKHLPAVFDLILVSLVLFSLFFSPLGKPEIRFEYDKNYVETPDYISGFENLSFEDLKTIENLPEQHEYMRVKRSFSLADFLTSGPNVLRIKDTVEHYLNYAWYPEEEGNNSLRWTSLNSSIVFFSEGGEKKFIFEVESFNKTRDLRLSVNDEFSKTFRVGTNKVRIFTPLLKLKNGRNVIRFEPLDGCDFEPPAMHRCLSIAFHNISVLGPSDLEEGKIYFENGWYPEEQTGNETYRWMSQNGTVSIYKYGNEENILTMYADSYEYDKNVDLFLNNRLLASIDVSKYGTVFSTNLTLQTGENVLKLVSGEGCILSQKTKNETRCLSIRLRNLSFIPMMELDNGTVFYSRWYPEDRDGSRWTKQRGSIIFITDYQDSHDFYLNLSLSAHSKKNVSIYLNNVLLSTLEVEEEKTFIVPLVNTFSGINMINIETDAGCLIPKQPISEDKRCLGFNVKNLQIDPYENLLDSNETALVFGQNWFDMENAGNITYRWMSENSTILLLNKRNMTMSLEFDISSYNRPRILNLYLNNAFAGRFNITTEYSKIKTNILELEHGINVLRFVPAEPCENPKNLESEESDERCLSFSILV
jgi:hypothetical protein